MQNVLCSVLEWTGMTRLNEAGTALQTRYNVTFRKFHSVAGVSLRRTCRLFVCALLSFIPALG